MILKSILLDKEPHKILCNKKMMLKFYSFPLTDSLNADLWFNYPSAAAAKSLQSCPTLCDPIDDSPSGSPVPGILKARTLEWVVISFSNGWKWKVKVKSLSCVQLLVTPWTAACQAPPSMGFSRQEHWSGLPLPSLYSSAVDPINLHVLTSCVLAMLATWRLGETVFLSNSSVDSIGLPRMLNCCEPNFCGPDFQHPCIH